MSFQNNVINSFKKVKEDMIKIETTLQHVIKEQQELNKQMNSLNIKQIKTEIKLKEISRRK